MTPTPKPTATKTPTLTPVSGSTYYICPRFDQYTAVRAGTPLTMQIKVCDAMGNNLSSSTRTVTALYLVDPKTGQHRPVYSYWTRWNTFYYSSTTHSYWLRLATWGLHSGKWQLVVKVKGDPNPKTINFLIK
jgi:hypothetical protein